MQLWDKEKRPGAVFWILSLLFAFSLFYRSSPAVIVENMAETFAVPAASLGLMASAYFYSYAVVQIPVGMLCDRMGVRHTVAGFGLLGVGGSVLFAFSPGILEASLGRLLIGAGTAGVWVPALKYLSLRHQPEEFATLSSVINLFGGLGIMAATLPLAVLVNTMGWRSPFVLAAVLFFFTVLTGWFLMGRDDRREKTKACEKEAVGKKKEEKPRTGNNPEKTRDAEEKPGPKNEGPGLLPGLFSILKTPSFWIIILWAFLIYGALFTFTGLWGSSYLERAFGVSGDRAGSYLMLTSTGFILGGPLWGLLSDRVFKARRPVLKLGNLGLLLCWLGLASLTSYPGGYWISALYFLFGLTGIIFLVNFSVVNEFSSHELTGTALGIVNMAMFVGVAVLQGATGYLFDIVEAASGTLAAFRTIFGICAGITALALALSFFIPETFPRKNNSQLES